MKIIRLFRVQDCNLLLRIDVGDNNEQKMNQLSNADFCGKFVRGVAGRDTTKLLLAMHIQKFLLELPKYVFRYISFYPARLPH